MLEEELRSGEIYKYGARGRLAMHEHRQGLGLGLAEARRIAVAHGGKCWLESTHLQGDTYVTRAIVEIDGAGSHGTGQREALE